MFTGGTIWVLTHGHSLILCEQRSLCRATGLNQLPPELSVTTPLSEGFAATFLANMRMSDLGRHCRLSILLNLRSRPDAGRDRRSQTSLDLPVGAKSTRAQDVRERTCRQVISCGTQGLPHKGRQAVCVQQTSINNSLKSQAAGVVQPRSMRVVSGLVLISVA